MIEYKKAFIDTAPIIYFIEKDENNPQFFDRIKDFFKQAYETDKKLVTSTITVEEYCVFPYRNQTYEYIDVFDKLVKTLDIEILDIDPDIARKAAQIRAEYGKFKAMDALQLAAAQQAKCDLFVTNDKQLKQYQKLACVTIDELG